MKKTGSLFATSMLMLVSHASAIGVGEAQVNSFLHQPLELQIPLVGTTTAQSENISVELASYEQFQRLGLDPTGLKQYQVKLVNLSAGPSVILTSDKPFKEAYVELAIVVKFAGGELIKAVSAFIDPSPAITETNLLTGEIQYKTAIRLDTVNSSEDSQKSINQAAKEKNSRLAPAQVVQLKGAKMWGPTQLNDSLWKVARRMRAEKLFDASLYQIMMAVFRLNPQAFYRGDIGRLKMAHMLTLPGQNQVNVLSRSQALQLFQAASRGEVTTRNLVRQTVVAPIRAERVNQIATSNAPSSSASQASDIKLLKAAQNLSKLSGSSETFNISRLASLQADIEANRATADELKHQNEALKFQLAEIVVRIDRMQSQLEQDVASTQKLLKDLESKGQTIQWPESPQSPNSQQNSNLALNTSGQRSLSSNETENEKSGSKEYLQENDASADIEASVYSEVSAEQETFIQFAESANSDSGYQTSNDATLIKEHSSNDMEGSKETINVGSYILGFLTLCLLAFFGLLGYYVFRRKKGKEKIQQNPIVVKPRPVIKQMEPRFQEEEEIQYQRKGMEIIVDEEEREPTKKQNYKQHIPAVNRNQVQLDLIKTSAEAYLAYGRYEEAVELVEFESTQQSSNQALTEMLHQYLVELKIKVAELESEQTASDEEILQDDAIEQAVAVAVADAYAESNEETQDQIETYQDELASMDLLDDEDYDDSVFDALDDSEVDDTDSLSKKAS